MGPVRVMSLPAAELFVSVNVFVTGAAVKPVNVHVAKPTLEPTVDEKSPSNPAPTSWFQSPDTIANPASSSSTMTESATEPARRKLNSSSSRSSVVNRISPSKSPTAAAVIVMPNVIDSPGVTVAATARLDVKPAGIAPSVKVRGRVPVLVTRIVFQQPFLVEKFQSRVPRYHRAAACCYFELLLPVGRRRRTRQLHERLSSPTRSTDCSQYRQP